MVRLVVLIETEDRRGKGTEDNPMRLVKQWFTIDGQLVVEKDPLKEGWPAEVDTSFPWEKVKP